MQICVPRNANQDSITTLTTLCSPKLLKSLHHHISDHLTCAQVADVAEYCPSSLRRRGGRGIIRSHHWSAARPHVKVMETNLHGPMRTEGTGNARDVSARTPLEARTPLQAKAKVCPKKTITTHAAGLLRFQRNANHNFICGLREAKQNLFKNFIHKLAFSSRLDINVHFHSFTAAPTGVIPEGCVKSFTPWPLPCPSPSQPHRSA